MICLRNRASLPWPSAGWTWPIVRAPDGLSDAFFAAPGADDAGSGTKNPAHPRGCVCTDRGGYGWNRTTDLGLMSLALEPSELHIRAEQTRNAACRENVRP